MVAHFVLANMHLSPLCCHWSLPHPPPPTPMFCPPVSLPLCCLSHHRTVKFILIPPFRRANCAHYLLSVLNCWINKLILTIYQPGDKLFGSRRLRSHDFFYLQFYNYSPGGESPCGAPSQKWNKTCAYIHDHVYSYKQPYVHVLHRTIAVIITLIIWTLAWNCTLLSSLTHNLNGEKRNVQQLEMQILYWAFCCSGHVHLITVFSLHQPPPRLPRSVINGGQRTHQSANHGSALVALRTLLTF